MGDVWRYQRCMHIIRCHSCCEPSQSRYCQFETSNWKILKNLSPLTPIRSHWRDAHHWMHGATKGVCTSSDAWRSQRWMHSVGRHWILLFASGYFNFFVSACCKFCARICCEPNLLHFWADVEELNDAHRTPLLSILARPIRPNFCRS